MYATEFLDLPPLAGAHGRVLLPGSKSISNRVLLLSALCQGRTTLHDLLDSDDTRVMLTALRQLGCGIQQDGHTVVIDGIAGRLPSAPIRFFMGNAGTAMRPLCAMLCAGQGDFTLTGEPRMYERPIGDLVDCLRAAGAQIDYLGTSGYPPLRLHAAGLQGGQVRIKGDISSQFLTGMLMAAPFCAGTLEIAVDGELVSKPYILITLDVMAKFGVTVENHDYQRFVIRGGQRYVAPGDIMVEGDASSASYFLAAAAIAGGTVRVHGTGSASVQGDARFAEVLKQMGAQVTWSENWIEVSRGTLRGVDVDLNHIPDAAMTIATTALFAQGSTAIRNIANWRVKETDRLSAMATELRKLGASVEEGADYLVITPPAHIRSAAIDTYDDHRMAMCFSLAAFGESAITINDPGCTSKTFPTYFDLFQGLCTAR